MKLVIVGAGGRMGQTLIRMICETDGVELSGALDREGSSAIGHDAGAMVGLNANGVMVTSDAETAFAEADGIIDFTQPEATNAYASYAAKVGLVHVIGTTGGSADDQRHIEDAAKTARIVKAGNMSLGVNLLAKLVEKAAAALGPDVFDIEVLEMHHKHKVDAPSGTALLLGESAATGRKIDLESHSQRVRDGHTGERKAGDIGFATLRGGSVVGDHSVIFAGPRERITLSHHAEDRNIFAQGAIRAAMWAHNQQPGLYSMMDVLGLND